MGKDQGFAGVRLAGRDGEGAKRETGRAGSRVQLGPKVKDLRLPPCSSLLPLFTDLDNSQETLLTPPALP